MALPEAVLWAALTCANGASPALINAIIEHESGGNPAAVHQNKNGSLDVGAMQINDSNWSRFHLTRETATDPCRSVDAGSKHLIADGGPDAVKPETVQALLHALDRYNPGDPNYAAKIVAIMARNANIPTPAAAPAAPKPAMPKRTLASQFPSFGGSH